MYYSAVIVSSFVVLTTATYLPTEECPILGPTFPSNFDITNASAFQDAVSSFPSLVEELFSSGVIDPNTSTFIADVFSTHSNGSIYTYIHRSPALDEALTAGTLDDRTVFRIGSVSKMMTVYSLLVQTGGLEVFNDPVTKWLPELVGNRGGALEKIVWEDVTVGALASQMGGTGSFPFESFCLDAPDQQCTDAEYFASLRDHKRPVFAPFHTSLYSDNGFGILGRVLERMTGMKYNDAIQHVLGGQLNLGSFTSFAPGGDGLNAFKLPGNGTVSSWGMDPQTQAPYVFSPLSHMHYLTSSSSGGVYTSTADLRTIGLSILNSRLLSPADTREWMKPRAHTSTLVFSNGAPWEIYRLALPVTPNSSRTRISDLYTKLGGNNGYTTVFALSPDHGIGYSILIGGPSASTDRFPLRDLVGETFITAAEHAGVEHGAKSIAGTYVSQNSSGTNLTFTVDADRPGLGLQHLYFEGVESRASLIQIGLEDEIPQENLTVRLYPMGLRSPGPSNSTFGPRTEYLAFRAAPQITPINPRTSSEGGVGMFDNSCFVTWSSVDFNVPDEFVLEFLAGRVQRVYNPLAQIWMSRV
ncbi:beta-lactamase/transpeptidase-like protein [Pseudovirgaria hyperparasitica]|uniref:Beta-lactamase/transpeptidase-like protein n=1 Tax=Pseudovirgaria hyperparasitica TaxID=470096 RepID=A0A6A6VXH3_9PEZI|nr:beta-lactamase/transpeptidase-like protein [Pseudovirgaria hyperparasitica]KAF2754506.1 beta-lactamase/transpeptidase-like protein [Pseudovirgaria hyperparasitica]